MKYLIWTIVFMSFSASHAIESFYQLPLNNIDGNAVALSSLRGRKIMIIVLPAETGDSGVTVPELDSTLAKYPGLSIIGIPAGETGYSEEDKEEVKAKYAELNSNFILAEGMKVSKSAGALQSSFFSWLTNRSKNGYYDTDVSGSGYKFFVNGSGRLYAVISGNTRLLSPMIDRIISR